MILLVVAINLPDFLHILYFYFSNDVALTDFYHVIHLFFIFMTIDFIIVFSFVSIIYFIERF